MKLGILDIGSNSVHLLLVDIDKDMHMEVLDRAKEFTHLGDSTFRVGLLSAQAIDTGAAAVSRFKRLADIRGVKKFKAVATSAVREAHNGGEFIDRIFDETGIRVRVITGDEEARLIALAARHSVQFETVPYLIMDLGGGSLELILANEQKVLAQWSLKLGARRLKEKFIKNDPPSKKEIAAIKAYITKLIQPVVKEVRKRKVRSVVGTSGTIMNLVSMAHGLYLDETLISQLNNYRIPAERLSDLDKHLMTADAKARLKLKGLDPNRNDIIIPGSMIVNELLVTTGMQDVILCNAALREGIVYDYMQQNRSNIEMETTVPNVRRRSVLQLAKKCDYPEEHSQHVSKLALSLYDQTQFLHKLGDDARELLEYACLLHDVGYHIHYKKHHKHSYYLIKYGEMNGFEGREIELIANIARYHCKSRPKEYHEEWSQLSSRDQRVAKFCASILRVADALDRSHFSVIRRIRCHFSGREITLDLFADVILHPSFPKAEFERLQKQALAAIGFRANSLEVFEDRR